MRIIENVVNKEVQDKLETIMLDTWFPWFYSKRTSTEGYNDGTFIDDKTKDHPMFNHTLFVNGQVNSNYWNDIAAPLLFGLTDAGIKTNRLVRIKANLVVPQLNYPSNFYSAPHIDTHWTDPRDEQYTFLYYVNDSDGDTYLFNEVSTGYDQPEKMTVYKTYTPKKGSGIYFNSSQYHTGCPPILSKERIVINFMFDYR